MVIDFIRTIEILDLFSLSLSLSLRWFAFTLIRYYYYYYLLFRSFPVFDFFSFLPVSLISNPGLAKPVASGEKWGGGGQSPPAPEHGIPSLGWASKRSEAVSLLGWGLMEGKGILK